jgi:tellurite resistance protein TerC
MVSLVWIGFVVFVLAMLALDLWVVNRGAHVISAAKALRWTGFFVALALLFNILVYFMYEHHWLGIGHRVGTDLGGREAAMQYFTGWLLEYSLSLDNVFVIALIFRHFAVPREYQHRVLFWGILGALVMRGIMIGIGAALIHKFEWMIYVFGAVLLATAIRLLFTGEKEPQPENGWIFRTARRLLPVLPLSAQPAAQSGIAAAEGLGGASELTGAATPPPPADPHGDRFFVRHHGALMVTPLFLVLLVVEGTDVIFAVDSIPAIFGVTKDPFLVFTSNVFAILGLRSLYFALAAIIDKFRYLKTALVFVLAFVAVKMLIPDTVLKIPTEASLIVIGAILALGVGISLLMPSRKDHASPQGQP